jgi:hypothetical protein
MNRLLKSLRTPKKQKEKCKKWPKIMKKAKK